MNNGNQCNCKSCKMREVINTRMQMGLSNKDAPYVSRCQNEIVKDKLATWNGIDGLQTDSDLAKYVAAKTRLDNDRKHEFMHNNHDKLKGQGQ